MPWGKKQKHEIRKTKMKTGKNNIPLGLTDDKKIHEAHWETSKMSNSFI